MIRNQWWTHVRQVFAGSILVTGAVVYAVSAPISPQYGSVSGFDGAQVTVVPSSALPQGETPTDTNLTGLYTGRTWPHNISAAEPVQIEIAGDRPRYVVLVTCTHELKHWRLEENGVPAVAHHRRMQATGFDPWHPLQWDPRCLQLVPKIAF